MKCDNPDEQIAAWQAKGLTIESRGVKLGDRAAEAKLERKRGKYGNQRVTIGGLTFDSKREAKRWLELVEEERAGRISQLERQVRFELSIAGVKVCDYVSDFCYIRDGQRVVEDSKGMKTAVYRLKKRMMLAVHQIEIFET